MLTALRLQNFKKHDDFRLEFGPGLTAVVGPNFAGKSSVLDGIAYALWGPRAVAGGADVCLKRGEDTLAVTLGFTLGETEFLLKRTKTTATLWKDGEVLAKSASAVGSKLQELLGLNQQRFTQMKVAQQKKTEALLTAGTTELHQVIEEVSGADVVSRILARASDRVRTAKAGLEAVPEVDPQATRETLANKQAVFQAAGERHAQTDEALEALEKRLSQARTQLLEAQEHNLRVRQQREDHARLDRQVREYAAELTQAEAELRKNRTGHEHAEALQEEVDELQGQLGELRTQSVRYEAALKALERAVGEVGEQELAVVRLDKTLSELRAPTEAKLEALRTEQVETEQALRTLEAQGRTLRRALKDATCPTCLRPFEDHDPAQLEQELEATLEQVEAAQEVADEAYDTWAEAAKAHKRGQQAQATLDAAQEKLASAEARAERAREELEGLDEPGDEKALGDELATLSLRAREAAEQAALYRRVQQRMTTLREKAAAARKQLQELPEPGEELDVDGARRAVETLEREVRETRTERDRRAEEKSHLRAEVSALQRELLHVEQQAAKREELLGQQKTAEQLAKYLRDNRDRFVAEVWAGITAYAGQFAGACTGGAIEALTRDELGEFTYVEGGEELPVAAASGAQRSIMGLGIQLALDRLLPSQLHVLLLDEPTADMAPDISMAATAQIQALGSQVVMVTHRELDGSVAENVISL